eukprot:s2321_g8.t1
MRREERQAALAKKPEEVMTRHHRLRMRREARRQEAGRASSRASKEARGSHDQAPQIADETRSARSSSTANSSQQPETGAHCTSRGTTQGKEAQAAPEVPAPPKAPAPPTPPQLLTTSKALPPWRVKGAAAAAQAGAGNAAAAQDDCLCTVPGRACARGGGAFQERVAGATATTSKGTDCSKDDWPWPRA